MTTHPDTIDGVEARDEPNGENVSTVGATDETGKKRPTTRSQTGTGVKAPARDDSDVSSAPKQGKTKAKTSKKRTVEQLDDEPGKQSRESAPITPAAQEIAATIASDPIPQPTPHPPPSHSVFIDARPHNVGLTPVFGLEPPNNRSRVVLPTPVPNLTKKSRGRRVPAVGANGSAAASSMPAEELGFREMETRLHVCKVDGCGKCFRRGEHLKRHIRSIHTHDKPFPCTFTGCEKYFNRHDNLLQHLKVHQPRELAADKPADEGIEPEEEDETPPAAVTSLSRPNKRRRMAKQSSLSLSHSSRSSPESEPAPVSAPVSALAKAIYSQQLRYRGAVGYQSMGDSDDDAEEGSGQRASKYNESLERGMSDLRTSVSSGDRQ
ncbi:hypothetical protein MIND_01260700 [Mycena indigotica]|uniref:C2H2-type domain-containing protein n=1 Tax=Mycena indigotica TaxID=2126181 RepID=A0A8H6VWW5_9AGAR|nr:uncharacterized protein MIND_01260700 [Mycena indigotica]KAF7291174.1 hypothetical protein MIND_01260700 [Mycena indigotica]